MTTTKTVVFLIVALLIVVFAPLCSIWALNTLFPVLAIPYSFETWCAVILVKGLLTVQTIKRN
jgi:hypothetical protein